MKTLPGDWADRVRLVNQDSPFVWCWDLQLQTNVSINLRAWVCNYTTSITIKIDLSDPRHPYSASGTTHTFRPFPVGMGDIEENTEGDVPQLQLLIGNQTRSLSQYFEVPQEEEGPIGSVAWGYLVNTSDLTAFESHPFRVKEATLTYEACALQLEFPSPVKRRIPQDRVSPAVCRWKHGTGTAARPSGCGYIVNGAAAFTTCTRLLNGAGGCIAHGDDEVARGLPRLHPKNFGAFLGVPQQ